MLLLVAKDDYSALGTVRIAVLVLNRKYAHGRNGPAALMLNFM